MLTVEEILAAQRRATVLVDVPVWGGEVRVRALSITEQQEYAKRFSGLGSTAFAEAILSELVVTEDCDPLFNGTASEVLQSMPLTAIEGVVRLIIEASGMVPDEDALGKSGATPSSGSSTDSRG